MPLLRKVLLKLTIVALLLVIFYFYLISNGDRYFVFNLQTQNANLANFTTTLTANNYSTKANFSFSIQSCKQSNYNVWCIFTKVAINSPMRHKFQIFVDSLLRLTTIDIAFHVISDDDSQRIAQTIIQDVMTKTEKFMEVYFFYKIYIYLLKILLKL